MACRFDIRLDPAQVLVLAAVLNESLKCDPSHRPDHVDPDFDARATLRDMLRSLAPDTLNDFTA